MWYMVVFKNRHELRPNYIISSHSPGWLNEQYSTKLKTLSVTNSQNQHHSSISSSTYVMLEIFQLPENLLQLPDSANFLNRIQSCTQIQLNYYKVVVVVVVSFSIPTRTTENFSHLMIFHFNKLLFFQALLNTLEQSHKELKRLFRLVKVNNISCLALFVRVARLPSFFAYVEHGFFLVGNDSDCDPSSTIYI